MHVPNESTVFFHSPRFYQDFHRYDLRISKYARVFASGNYRISTKSKVFKLGISRSNLQRLSPFFPVCTFVIVTQRCIRIPTRISVNLVGFQNGNNRSLNLRAKILTFAHSWDFLTLLFVPTILLKLTTDETPSQNENFRRVLYDSLSTTQL